jgi:Asp-tRNA(Asn)/Glu-tRNA(Gln) amidotransferase A subunit family amidase
VDAEVAANAAASADRLRTAGVTVEEVTLPWDLATINRAARIHFGMIFGPSLGDLYPARADELTSYARRFAEEAAQVSKGDFVAGLKLEAGLYQPLGELLEEYDALICPTFAVPALPGDERAVRSVPGRCPHRAVDRRPDLRRRHRVPRGGRPRRGLRLDLGRGALSKTLAGFRKPTTSPAGRW